VIVEWGDRFVAVGCLAVWAGAVWGIAALHDRHRR
jgi:hypothetical protein